MAALALGTGLAVVPGHPAGADAFAEGYALHQQKEFQEAHRLYLAATREASADAEVWYHLGLTESALDNPGGAAHAFAAALQAAPTSPFAYRFRTNLGWSLIAAGDIGPGLEALAAVAEARPEDFRAVANVAHAYFLYADDFNQAEAWYQKLADTFPAGQGERPVAEQWLREARQQATITKIGTGFDVYRGDIVGGTYRGRTYGPSPSDSVIVFRTVEGKTVTLRESEIRTVSTEPKYKGLGRTMRGGKQDREPYTYDVIPVAENLTVGQARMEDNDPAAAEAQFAIALRKAPASEQAPFALALARYRLGKYAEAVELFEDCVETPGTATRARYYLVSAYANHLHDLPAALEHALAYVQIPNAPQQDVIDGAAVKIVRKLVAENQKVPESQWTRNVGLDLEQVAHRRILGLAYLRENDLGPALRHLGAAVEMGTGLDNREALNALELCLTRLEASGTAPPAVAYYRGYQHFASGQIARAAAALEAASSDTRSQTLLALVRAYEKDTDAARAALDTIDRAALPPPTRRLYDVTEAILDAPTWYDQQVAARKKDEFGYSRIGAVNGLGVYSATDEGDLMPIIVVCKKNGRGRLEVNGNPQFDLFSVISFKEAFDWVENSIDASFPNEWDTTVTFGGLSLYTAKGGDSAGCAIALALASAVTEQPVLQDVAITGAIRLDGRVEPVGAVPQKVSGALAKGIRTIILPAANAKELGDPDPEVCSRVKFVTVASVAEARVHAYGPGNPKTAEEFERVERRFRTGCRYFQLGAYSLARPELEAVREAWPENLSARRLLDVMGDRPMGRLQADAIGG